jgi:DNA transformation protein
VSHAKDYATHIVDLLHAFGDCEASRMFGGFGIFHQSLMFGLIADGNLYLKADAESRECFVAEGSSTFSYFKKDKEYHISYYLVADEFFEDDAACLRWARLAFDAALRNPTKPKKQKS